jgi:hypothetical protein
MGLVAPESGICPTYQQIRLAWLATSKIDHQFKGLPAKTTKTIPAIKTIASSRRIKTPRAENNERIIDNFKNQFYIQFTTTFVQFITVKITRLVQSLLKPLPRFTPGVFGVCTRVFEPLCIWAWTITSLAFIHLFVGALFEFWGVCYIIDLWLRQF